MNLRRRTVIALAAASGGAVSFAHCSSSESSPFQELAPTTIVEPSNPGTSMRTTGEAPPSNTSTGNPDWDAIMGSTSREPGVPKNVGLSAVVAISLKKDATVADFPDYVKRLSTAYVAGQDEVGFPVAALSMDLLRSVPATVRSVVVKWLDPLTPSTDANAARFGANTDFIAYFGEGWDQGANPTPYFSGSATKGWMWVNHEYISGTFPLPSAAANQPGTAPVGQHLALAQFLSAREQLSVTGDGGVSGGANWNTGNVDVYTQRAKREYGGSWMRVEQDPATLAWRVDPSAKNVRFDSTSSTLARVTSISLSGRDHTDDGSPLPEGVVAGINADCSGTVTPWGTIISAEENAQTQWGDVEQCWNDRDNTLKAGAGCDAGQWMRFARGVATSSDFGRHTHPNTRHAAEGYGYLVEMDLTAAPDEFDGKRTPGVGHKKLGAFGRARWENASFVVDATGHLPSGRPITFYAGDDRYGGRMYKFVSSRPYQSAMSRADARALLDGGEIFVAQFEGMDNDSGLNLKATGKPPTTDARGHGRWIRLARDNWSQQAINAPALQPGITVGAALSAISYNGIGGFETSDDVRRALYTAGNKVGIFELNRPEDVEYNAKSPFGRPGLFVAFTKNDRRTALDDRGVLRNASDMTIKPRADKAGAIFVVEEANSGDPSASQEFSFFEAFHGTSGSGLFDAANPDNLVVDRDGNVWFGTDGNLETNAHSDAVYYLDLDPAHKTGARPTFGKPYRIAAMPSDAEATGPAFTPDMRTLFVSVQHPGEDKKISSGWPR